MLVLYQKMYGAPVEAVKAKSSDEGDSRLEYHRISFYDVFKVVITNFYHGDDVTQSHMYQIHMFMHQIHMFMLKAL